MRSTGSSDSDEQLSDGHTYFRGVYPCGKRWKAQIHFEGSQHYLGTYETPEEAAQAYDEAARAHHGERGKTNYDRNGDLTEAIKRRRARPRQHKRSIPKTHSIAPNIGSTVLGKRPLELPSSQPMLSGPSRPTQSEESAIDIYTNSGERLRAQIAVLMENRALLEAALNGRHPYAGQSETLLDEYVVCTIRLDDLFRRLRRTESHDAAPSGSAESSEKREASPADQIPPHAFAASLPVQPRYSAPVPYGPHMMLPPHFYSSHSPR